MLTTLQFNTKFPLTLLLLFFLNSFTSKVYAVAVDLVFVLDESSNISASGLGRSGDFILNSIHNLPIGYNDINVGIVSFADSSRDLVPGFGIDTNYLTNVVASIVPSGGQSCPSCGLDRGYDLLINYGRSGVKKAVVMLSNGNWNTGANPFTLANEALNLYDIYTFAFDAESKSNYNNLKSLSLNGGTSGNVYTATDFPEFYQDFGDFSTAVPVPAACWLFISGLFGLTARKLLRSCKLLFHPGNDVFFKAVRVHKLLTQRPTPD